MLVPDLLYVVSLAKQLRESLGFLPLCAYDLARAESRLQLQRDNDQPIGFLLHGRPRPGKWLRIYQTAIQLDARRLHNATALVHSLEAQARVSGCPGVSLCCAAELEANAFWQSLGYVAIEVFPGGGKRRRRITRYAKLIPG
jgi:GNAT superfamily N-acetyltransferase